MTTKEPLKTQLKTKDYHKLKSLLAREPKHIEIVLALALWNEHCSYRSSKKHLPKLQFITQKKISCIGEQAGLVDLGLGERVSFKMESHNHPSFIIPYHGAATGVGGILRDIFAMNARPIALANFLCFSLSSEKSHLDRVKHVISGIGDYGNCIGIPTLTSQVHFSKSYDKNIVVNAMALGYLDSKTKVVKSQAKGVGNHVVYAGSATGRDGVLGASMASAAFKNNEKSSKTTVQIGDPFFGRQLLMACLEAMNKDLIVACQDMGAAGLTCSSFEMSDKAGLGLSLHLDKVPLRDTSLGPTDILLSESQERMLFICEPKKWKTLQALFKNYGLHICIIGEVLNQKHLELFWHNKSILKTDPKFWTSHSPTEDCHYTSPKTASRVIPEKLVPKSVNIKDILLKSLSSWLGRKRQYVYQQYDQRVGTNTVKDSSYPIAVVRLPESQRDLGISMGCSPYLMELDVVEGSKDAIFTPAIQLALRSFTPWAVTDCLNFGNPEKSKVMSDFVASIENISAACKILDTAIVSGNVSFYNETDEQNIPPTPSIAMIGLKEDKHTIIPDSGFQTSGEQVYLLSSHQFYFQGAFKHVLTSSQQLDQAYGSLQNPRVDLFIKSLLKLSKKIPFSSASLVGKFGLPYSLACMVLKNSIGFELNTNFPYDLVQERLYEVIISVSQKHLEAFQAQVQKLALTSVLIGQTTELSSLKLQNQTISLQDMKTAYHSHWQGEISS